MPLISSEIATLMPEAILLYDDGGRKEVEVERNRRRLKFVPRDGPVGGRYDDNCANRLVYFRFFLSSFEEEDLLNRHTLVSLNSCFLYSFYGFISIESESI